MLNAMETNLGNFIRQIREREGLTLDAFGRRLGRPATWVFNMETGKRKNLPEPEELRAVAAALGVSHVDLLEASGYLTPADRGSAVTGNPFPMDDPRWQVVETLRRFPLNEKQAESISGVIGLMAEKSQNE